MDGNRDLVLGAIAVQLGLLSPADLIALETTPDPEAADIGSRLVAAGLLTEEDRRLVDALAAQVIAGKGADPAATHLDVSLRAQVLRGRGSATRLPGNGPTPGTEPISRTVTGHYRQLGELARGGIGRVLLAHDTLLDRQVALKELLPGEVQASADKLTPPAPGRVARFLREARITGRLEHPSILPVYELGQREDGTPYYTMKLIRGRTLQEALKEASGLEQRLALLPHLVNMCQAVAYAHSRGVLHRDLKPANVMVGEFGETVIIDWGLAKVKSQTTDAPEAVSYCGEDPAGTEADLTQMGQSLGTPQYMPPEQAAGQLHLVDERSDVYALGATLYAVLTGKPPFGGTNQRAVLKKVLREPPPPIRDLEPDTPGELAAICEKAMAKPPEDRYPSARDLAEELQRFLTGGLVSAYDYRLSEHLRRLARRHRRVLATAAVAAVAMLAVAVGSYVRILGERNVALSAGNEAIAARNEAVSARDDALQARNEAAEAREWAEREAYNRTIAYVHGKIQQGDHADVPRLLEELPERFRGWEWGYLIGQCRLEEKRVQAHTKPLVAFAASRDASILATAGQDGELVVWDGHSLDAVLDRLCDASQVNPNFLNRLAWRWVAEQDRLHAAAVRVARKGVAHAPGDANILDTLAYVEWRAGETDNAIEHARKSLAMGNVVSQDVLAGALLTHGADADVAEACDLLEKPAAGRLGVYQQRAYEALEAHANASSPRDPQLRQRIRALLDQRDKAGE